MTDVLLSKTVRLAMIFAGLGFVLIVGDASYFQATDDHLSFVTEFFGLLGIMFGALTAKNFGDNVISYQRDRIQYQATGTLPASPVKQ